MMVASITNNNDEMEDKVNFDEFLYYLSNVCGPIFGLDTMLCVEHKYTERTNDEEKFIGVYKFFKESLNTVNTKIIETFISKENERIIQINLLTYEKSNKNADEIQPQTTCTLSFHLGIYYESDTQIKKTESITLLKRRNSIILKSISIAQQVQIITFRYDDENSNNIKTNRKETPISMIYNYVSQSLGPLFSAYAKVYNKEREISNLDNKIGLPVIHKKFKELELSLSQFQQNVEIPQVHLQIHPDIQKAIENYRQAGNTGSMDLEKLGLTNKLSDDIFINSIQSSVNTWIQEIQKITRLNCEKDKIVSTNSEIQFWTNLNAALLGIQQRIESDEVEITLLLLRQAKRFLVSVAFASDTDLVTSLKRVNNIMVLMKDFPLNNLLSCTTFEQIGNEIEAIFSHLKKIKLADQYELSRSLLLVEAISRDLAMQLINIINNVTGCSDLLQIPFEDFEKLIYIKSMTNVFDNWQAQFKCYYEFIRELSKKRGTYASDPLPLYSDINSNDNNYEHKAIEKRIKEIYTFRENHEKLIKILGKIVNNDKNTGRNLETVDLENALSSAHAAYTTTLLKIKNALDISNDGGHIWYNNRMTYERTIENIDKNIIENLIFHLDKAKTADEMSNVFKRYKYLFFRPSIKNIIHNYQMLFMRKIKEDIDVLQETFIQKKKIFAANNNDVDTFLRDIPPVSSAIIYSKTVERKLFFFLDRLDSIYGDKSYYNASNAWEHHAEGKILKSKIDTFLSQLNTRPIFDQWVSGLSKSSFFEGKGSVFKVVAQVSNRSNLTYRTLEVAYNNNIIALFKDVRILENFGFFIPYTIKVMAEEAKEKYPFAVSLRSTLRAYNSIMSNTFVEGNLNSTDSIMLLCSPLIKHFQETIDKAFIPSTASTNRVNTTLQWMADKLPTYVKELAEKIETIIEKTDYLDEKKNIISNEIERLVSCNYNTKDFNHIIGNIQKVIDEMSLNGYSNNLFHYVENINMKKISPILAKRLEENLLSWKHDICEDSIMKNNFLTMHQILLKNQALVVHPPVNKAKEFCFQRLQELVCTVTNVSTIQSTTFLNNLDVASVCSKHNVSTFSEVLHDIDKSLYLDAHALVLAITNKAELYIEKWLQYQTLWDISVTQIINQMGENIVGWEKLLVQFQQERNNVSDNSGSDSENFGPIKIDCQQIRNQINIKYDMWHKELLLFFSNLLREKMLSFYDEIKNRRDQLESYYSFESDTQQVVATVTFIQETNAIVEQKWHDNIKLFYLGERILKKQRFAFNNHDKEGTSNIWPNLSQIEGEWESLVQLLEKKRKQMTNHLPALQKKILNEDSLLQEKKKNKVLEWDNCKPLRGDTPPSDAITTVTIFQTSFKQLLDEEQKLTNAKKALSLDLNDNNMDIRFYILEVESLHDIWSHLINIWNTIYKLKDERWLIVQPKKLKATLDDIYNNQMKSLPDHIRQYESYEHLANTVKKYESYNSILLNLKSDSLRDRHWKDFLSFISLPSLDEYKKINKGLNLSNIDDILQRLTLGDLLDANLTRYEDQIKVILKNAQGEMALEEFLKLLDDHWNTFSLVLVTYVGSHTGNRSSHGTKLIKNWDDIFAKAEEHLNNVRNMKSSPYCRLFQHNINKWEIILNKINLIFQFWIRVQKKYIYLEGIFINGASGGSAGCSNDIRNLLPKEFLRFKNIDNEYNLLMKKVANMPHILHVIEINSLYSNLEKKEDQLNKIIHSLTEYLTKQRNTFSRFFFVGDEDLLDMIGSSKNMKNMSKYLMKMFAGVSSLILADCNHSTTRTPTEYDSELIIGMVSREGERVLFSNKINVSKENGINVWLARLESEMKLTLSSLLEKALNDKHMRGIYNFDSAMEPGKYFDWIDRFPGQIVVLASQIFWTEAIEKYLNNKSENKKLLVVFDELLSRLSSTVLQDSLSIISRKKYENLITEIVHHRDVFRSISKKVSKNSMDYFDWERHMRFYYKTEKRTCHIKIGKSTFLYGFEYLGLTDRLIYTKLTTQCYLTLTQALGCYRMGGNPFGPAGTGKTESVKSLGQLLGRFVIVFNCDEKFDYFSMGRIFTGLCQVGAWGCFDEFNRLSERALSAVSQQILTIQTGLLKGSKEIDIMGGIGSVTASNATNPYLTVLNEDVGIFVTMNPGYSGRSDLPGNLKLLFRSIAMIEPDKKKIGEILLLSQGIKKAEYLSDKIVLLFQLCSDQLSKQQHYDFGLRALKAVLLTTGSLKRKYTDVESSKMIDATDNEYNEENILKLETNILIQSIHEMIVPVLIQKDLELFKGLICSVFPSYQITPKQDQNFEKIVNGICEKRFLYVPNYKLNPSPIYEKITQLLSIKELRLGLMLVGPSGSGKSTVLSVLLQALEVYNKKIKNEVYPIDPKALTKDQLFGKLDSTTYEWTDGLFTHLIRNIINSNTDKISSKHYYIVFDGDVDPAWAENLNSVLDDNRLLSLASGERLEIPNNVTIIIETESLKYATLATVSRCGMIFFSEAAIASDQNIIQHLFEVSFFSDNDNNGSIINMTDEENEEEKSRKELIQKRYADIIKPYVFSLSKKSSNHNNDTDESESLINKVLKYSMSLPSHIMEVSKLSLLNSFFTILKNALHKIYEYNASNYDFPINVNKNSNMEQENSDDIYLINFAVKYLCFALLWGFGSSLNNDDRIKLSNYIVKNIGIITLPDSVTLVDLDVFPEKRGVLDDNYSCFIPWKDKRPHHPRASSVLGNAITDSSGSSMSTTDSIITTVDTLRHESVVSDWTRSNDDSNKTNNKFLLLCGPPGSGKTMTLTNTLNNDKFGGSSNYHLVTLNFSSETTPELILQAFAQYCEYVTASAGNTISIVTGTLSIKNEVLRPLSKKKKLIIFCDEINLPAVDAYNTQKIITFLRQVIEKNGFWKVTSDSSTNSNVWVTLENITFIGACNPPTDPGRNKLHPRFLRFCPILYVDFPTRESLVTIYNMFLQNIVHTYMYNAGVASAQFDAGILANVLVDVYLANYSTFTTEDHEHYIYSPRELSRWIRAIEEISQINCNNSQIVENKFGNFILLVFHEGMRLFMDRLVTEAEKRKCYDFMIDIFNKSFPGIINQNSSDISNINIDYDIYFGNWLTKYYCKIEKRDLFFMMDAKLKIFYEEVGSSNNKIILFDDILQHILRIDRVLKQPIGHLLLVGQSGVGKKMLTHFVSWLNNYHYSPLKIRKKNYNINDFNDDLLELLLKTGIDNEKVVFVFDESNILHVSFLENMNCLLASGEIPGFFNNNNIANNNAANSKRDYKFLIQNIKQSIESNTNNSSKNNLYNRFVFETDDDYYKYFIKNVQRNLHVVFTINSNTLLNTHGNSNTSPALFNRCVINWFEEWDYESLKQIATSYVQFLDLPSVSENGQNDDMLETVVECLVRIHSSLIESGKAFEGICPRDFMIFLDHFVHQYNLNKRKSEENMHHLNVGITKLRTTQDHILALNKELEKKRSILSEKEVIANNKLQEIIIQQKENEMEKKNSEVLHDNINMKKKTIEERKSIVNDLLANIQPELDEAVKNVEKIKKTQLDEIRGLSRPPNAVRITLEAVTLLLSSGSTDLATVTDWTEIRKLMRNSDFINQIIKFDCKKLDITVRNKIEKDYINDKNNEFTYEKVNHASKACGPLLQWVVSQVNYNKLIHNIEPLRKEVEELEETSKEIVINYNIIKKKISECETNIIKYETEYGTLINEIQLIKNEMKNVISKVSKSEKLIHSLETEQKRWDVQLTEYNNSTNSTVIVGNSLLCSGFLTYFGGLEYKKRLSLKKRWNYVLKSCCISFDDNISFIDQLSTSKERLEWEKIKNHPESISEEGVNHEENDDLFTENLLIINNNICYRYPLIIDPAGQTIDFLIKRYKSSNINVTSFLDDSFIKILISCVRFGHPVIINDAEHIDPVVFPLLSREIVCDGLNGGRKKIRIGKDEVDFSEGFVLFMSTRDDNYKFNASTTSKVTLVKYNITPLLLKNKLTSLFVKKEKPEYFKELKKNILLQHESNIKLRIIEDDLLKELNENNNENILDDDTFMNLLEGMKSESSNLVIKINEINDIIYKMNNMTMVYHNISKITALVFFLLRDLQKINYIYQFSLSFYIDIIHHVMDKISIDKEQSSIQENERIKLIGLMLLKEIYYRIQKTLLQQDQITFGLCLVQYYHEFDQNIEYGIDMNDDGGVPESEEMKILLSNEYFFNDLVNDIENNDKLAEILSSSILTPKQIRRLVGLLKMPFFTDTYNDMVNNISRWEPFFESLTPETCFPDGWNHKNFFHKLLLILAVFPKRFSISSSIYLSSAFDSKKNETGLRNRLQIEYKPFRPVIFISKNGFDALPIIQSLQLSKNNIYCSMSMGSVEVNGKAEKAINHAIINGGLIFLRNIHLSCDWLKSFLENKLYRLNNEKKIENINEVNNSKNNFHLFLTSEMNDSLPPSLLLLCDIYVIESPNGIRENLIKLYENIPETQFVDTKQLNGNQTKPIEINRLYYLLCWFHTIITERLRYVPVGWSKSYEFSSNDLQCAFSCLDQWLDSNTNTNIQNGHIKPEHIPWKTIQIFFLETIYGAKITNPQDKLILKTILKKIFQPQAFHPSFPLVEISSGNGQIVVLEACEDEIKQKCDYLSWINKSIPENNPPTWLGLPESAEEMILLEKNNIILSNVKLLLQSDDMNDTVEPIHDDSSKSFSFIKDNLPKWIDLIRTIDIPKDNDNNNDNQSKLYYYFQQEIEFGKEIISQIHHVFKTIHNSIIISSKLKDKNKFKISNDIKYILYFLTKNIVPKDWLSLYTMPNNILFSEWLSDLICRMEQLKYIIHHIQTDHSNHIAYWIGGFFMPDGFLSVMGRIAASNKNCSLSDLKLTISNDKSIDPNNIFTLQGLYSEGISIIINENNNININFSNELRCKIPLITCQWIENKDLNTNNINGIYRPVPLYLNKSREKLLCVIYIFINTNQNIHSNNWIERNIAFILWDNNNNNN